MNHTVHTYRALGLGDVGLPEHVLVEAFLGELGLLRPGTVVLNLADSETEATAVVRAQEDVDLGDAHAGRVRGRAGAWTALLRRQIVRCIGIGQVVGGDAGPVAPQCRDGTVR